MRPIVLLEEGTPICSTALVQITILGLEAHPLLLGFHVSFDVLKLIVMSVLLTTYTRVLLRQLWRSK
jgi:hypothetical protein